MHGEAKKVSVCCRPCRHSVRQCEWNQQQPAGGIEGRVCKCELCRAQTTQGDGLVGDLSQHAASSAQGLQQGPCHLLTYALLLAGSIGHRPKNATVFCPWPSSPFLSWCIPSPLFLFPCLFARCFVPYLFYSSLGGSM